MRFHMRRSRIASHKGNARRPVMVPPSEVRVIERSPPLFAFSYSAFDFRAAAFANVGHLDQAIAEFDCLARLRSRWSVFLGRHSATTARTDHDWLFLARHHGREVNMMCRCRKETKVSVRPIPPWRCTVVRGKFAQ